MSAGRFEEKKFADINYFAETLQGKLTAVAAWRWTNISQEMANSSQYLTMSIAPVGGQNQN